MKKQLLIICTIAAMLLGLTTASHAIPALQLYIEGSTYDSTTETWTIATTDSIKLWVIGGVGDVGRIDAVKLAVAYDTGLSPSFSFDPTTVTAGLGFTDPSAPSDPAFRQVGGDGTIPTFSDGSALPPHGLYGPGTSWTEYLLGDFTLTDSTIADFSNAFPSPTTHTGQINAYTITISGIPSGSSLHFDAYDHYYSNTKAKYIKAPFSHDGEMTTVPEPATLLLLGAGLLGVGAFRRKK